jgi:hypothetical protein
MAADSRRPHFYERKLGKHISFLPSWFKEESWLLRTKTPASNNHKIAAEPFPHPEQGGISLKSTKRTHTTQIRELDKVNNPLFFHR